MNKKQYDERQYIERGKSFQTAFVSEIIINIIIYILSEFIGISFANGAVFLINVGVPIAIYTFSMIIKDCYDGISSIGEKMNISAIGACGLVLLFIYLPDIISGKKAFMTDSVITENAGALIISIFTLIVVLTYWVKKLLGNKNDKKKGEVNDEMSIL